MTEYICLSCFHQWLTEGESPRWGRCSGCGRRMGVPLRLFQNLVECIQRDRRHRPWPPPPMRPPRPPLPDIETPGAIVELLAAKPSAAPLIPHIVAEAKRRAG